MSNKEFLQAVGMEVKVARIRKGLQVADVAKSTGLHSQTIRSIETGARASDLLSYKRIADVLEVELKTFVQ